MIESCGGDSDAGSMVSALNWGQVHVSSIGRYHRVEDEGDYSFTKIDETT